MVDDVDRHSRQLADMVNKNNELQLKLMQNYVNPHFLFNGLNAIGSLVHDDPDKAQRYIDSMSKTLRYMLQMRNRRVVPIAEELVNLSNYIELIGLRYDCRVHVGVNIDAETSDYYICPGTLQLLVENAVKHNRHSVQSPLMIAVDDVGDCIVVTNNYSPFDTEGFESDTRFGLDSIKMRMSALEKGRVTHSRNGDKYEVKVAKIYDLQ